MREKQLSELLQRAERAGDGEAWIEAARSLNRVGRGGRAAQALDRAASHGAEVEDLRESFEPESLEAFQLLRLGPGDFLGGRLDHPLFSPEGDRVYAIQDHRRVLEWSIPTGSVRLVGELPQIQGRFVPGIQRLGWLPGGESLAIAQAMGGQGWDEPHLLTRMSLSDGSLPTKPLATTRGSVMSLHELDGDLVLVELPRRVQVFRLDGDSPEPIWDYTAPVIGVGRRVLGVKRGKLQAVRALGDAPETLCPASLASKKRNCFAAARDRAVLRGPDGDVVLLGTSGERGRAKPPPDFTGYLVPSPSGRYVVLQDWKDELRVLDLRQGILERFDMGSRLRFPAWSPDGRTLVVPTGEGELALLAAGDAGDRAAGPEVPDWVELRRRGRFWRVRVQGEVLETRWGEVGAPGTYRSRRFPSPEKARRELAKRIRSREAEGFRSS